ncbi:MAG TPA: serine/threonine-protein kinase [Gemmatimonadales bacterium]|nr:serine/threonine-protein kinase [Gemmatimonadales bacterium]
MVDPTKLIAPPLPSTPSGVGTVESRLPPELLRDASRRLGIMALVGATLWVLGDFLAHFATWTLSGRDPRYWQLAAEDVFAAMSVAVSLGLFLYTRRQDSDPRFSLDLGLVYMMYTAVALGLMIHWEKVPQGLHVFPLISWIGAIVLAFAAIVPSTPGKTLVAGLIAVSMNPIGMVTAKARGVWDYGPWENVVVMHYPDYILLGVAVVISYVMTRLSLQVAKAKEMGSYRLGELIGTGGMGEVYRATHRMLARPAAIKLIRPGVLGRANQAAADLAVKRFWREAEAAASLRSQHTVELYDFGVMEDQTVYFVMELLDGMDLEAIVRKNGPLPAGRVVYLLTQVCESLEEAHSRGLVHRDIKPANIHVGRMGLRHDYVKVLDFGLVKSVSTDSDETVGTMAGFTPGTPAYMAPEQAMGEKVDHRADIYALGCVAYFMLTGQKVFEADTPFQMINRHLNDIPVPPSKRTELPIPPSLENLVLSCLAKNPADRPQSAAELGKALLAVETEPWTEGNARKWWMKHQPA